MSSDIQDLLGEMQRVRPSDMIGELVQKTPTSSVFNCPKCGMSLRLEDARPKLPTQVVGELAQNAKPKVSGYARCPGCHALLETTLAPPSKTMGGTSPAPKPGLFSRFAKKFSISGDDFLDGIDAVGADTLDTKFLVNAAAELVNRGINTAAESDAKKKAEAEAAKAKATATEDDKAKSVILATLDADLFQAALALALAKDKTPPDASTVANAQMSFDNALRLVQMEEASGMSAAVKAERIKRLTEKARSIKGSNRIDILGAKVALELVSRAAGGGMMQSGQPGGSVPVAPVAPASGSFLTARKAGLPVWAWAGIGLSVAATAGVVIIKIIRRRK